MQSKKDRTTHVMYNYYNKLMLSRHSCVIYVFDIIRVKFLLFDKKSFGSFVLLVILRGMKLIIIIDNVIVFYLISVINLNENI